MKADEVEGFAAVELGGHRELARGFEKFSILFRGRRARGVEQELLRGAGDVGEQEEQ